MRFKFDYSGHALKITDGKLSAQQFIFVMP